MSRTIHAFLAFATLTACGNDVTHETAESQLKATNDIKFVIPAEDATYRFQGIDHANKPCELVIGTNRSQWITQFILTGSFRGNALSTPSTMTPVSGGGYEGVVDLFARHPYQEFGYDNHFFRPGVTLYSSAGRIEAHHVEAKLFGEALLQLKEVNYSSRAPFLTLDGVCKNLKLASQQ